VLRLRSQLRITSSGVIWIFEFGDVGQAADALLVLRKDSDGGSLNFDGASGYFLYAHRLWGWSRANSIEFEGIQISGL